MENSWQKEFENPTSACRAKPFWAWNGKLEEKELKRQVRLLGKMGFGGFFMHSRTGLATPYLSKEWFNLVDACVGEAFESGMEAWLYDEDRWPSGAAGGLVTRKPQFQMKYLEMTVQSPRIHLRRDRNLVAVFTAKLDSGKISAVERLQPKQALSAAADKTDRKKLVFRVKSESPSDWYNGYTYLDVLNPKAVKEFIRVTHEGYRKHVGSDFGKTIPGIFTDEPNYHGSRPKGYNLSWTGALPDVFKRRYGYDLIDHLPELFFLPAGIEFSRVRYHFINCITWMFTDSFARQSGEWCGRNKLLFTGHVLGEDTLRGQTAVVGSAMRFYEHMQAPGMDLLTEHRRIYDTAKQVSSVARQFGRKWRLSETDGCTGWDFSFAGHKALGDWQAALGINLRCPHLSWYTMEGQAKRDYPASIFYQSPWWRDYRIVEDYFARIHAVMTRGEEIRDLLVIHPIESLWGACRIGAADWRTDPATIQHNRQLQIIRDALLSNHIDFDYGDEDIIRRHGKVNTAATPGLIIGQAAYKAVLVPPMVTIRSSTLALLRRFKSASGLVVFAGQPPEYVDGLPSPAAVELSRKCIVKANQASDFIPVLASACRRISVVDGEGNEIHSILYLLRSDRESFYLFLCNTAHSRSQMNLPQDSDAPVAERKTAVGSAFIRGFGECAGAPIELDPSSGKTWPARAERKNGLWEIQTSFPALGSRLFVIPKEKKKKTRPALPARQEWKTIKRVRIEKNWWPIGLSENNCLALDCPCFKIGKSAWRGPEEILRVDGAVRDSLGWKRRGGSMVQPWARKDVGRALDASPSSSDLSGASQAKALHEKNLVDQETIELKYEFNVATLPSGGVFLAVERPDLYAIIINGVPVETDMDCGWWVDRSLRKVPLPSGALKTGRNEIRMVCKYTSRHPGFEMIYLLGAFGVRLQNRTGCVTEMPRFLKLGDWCRQGLPFYSGSVGYTCRTRVAVRSGQRVVLDVPEYSGVAVKVWVDGKEAGYAAWPPYQVDITQLLDNEAPRVLSRGNFAEPCEANPNSVSGLAKKGKNRRHELRIEVLGHRRNSHGPLHHANKHPVGTGPGQFISRDSLWNDDYQLVPCGLQKPPELLTLVSVRDKHKM